ncbi:hypothetical protein TNCV_1004031 [Trichonephila clavipes]|nr:hypothetical protein TNCV_1004031 [Trichonephila clavipes]
MVGDKKIIKEPCGGRIRPLFSRIHVAMPERTFDGCDDVFWEFLRAITTLYPPMEKDVPSRAPTLGAKPEKAPSENEMAPSKPDNGDK